MDEARILPFGETAILVVLGDRIDPELNVRVHKLAARVRAIAATDSSIEAPVPGFASVLVPFDPLVLDTAAATARLTPLVRDLLREAGAGGRTHDEDELPTIELADALRERRRAGSRGGRHTPRALTRPGRRAPRLGRVPRLLPRLRARLRPPRRSPRGDRDSPARHPPRACAREERRDRRGANGGLPRRRPLRLADHRADDARGLESPPRLPCPAHPGPACPVRARPGGA
jgi:hypothetical protein